MNAQSHTPKSAPEQDDRQASRPRSTAAHDRRDDRGPPPRASVSRAESPAGKSRGVLLVRPADRPADGDPRHHRREHRAAEPRRRPRAERLDGQLDDHELLARLRQPAPLRRSARRPGGSPAHVPDRPRRLHRRVGRLGARGHRCGAVRRPRRSGPRGRDALPGRPLDHHDGVPGQAAGEGARRLGRRRWRRRRDRRPRRRRPHRGRRLAADLLREHPDRDRARRRLAEGHPRRRRQAELARPRRTRRPARHRQPRRRSSTRSPRRITPAGARPRRSGSQRSPSSAWASSRPGRGAPRSRSCGSSGSSTGPSAAGCS